MIVRLKLHNKFTSIFTCTFIRFEHLPPSIALCATVLGVCDICDLIKVHVAEDTVFFLVSSFQDVSPFPPFTRFPAVLFQVSPTE